MSRKLSKHIDNRLEKLLVNTGDMALKRRARRIIEDLDPKNGDKILDVGCGDGYYLHLLSNLGLKLKLAGVDFDLNALASARKNLRKEKTSLVQADLMRNLPFSDNSFDKVVMSEVVEHLPNDVKGLKEVYRVLKPGGVLCLSVPNATYPLLWDPVNWVLEHFLNTHIRKGFWAGIWNQHLRLYRPLQIKKVIKKAGFGVSKVESLTFWCLPFNHHIVNFGARLLAGKRGPVCLTSGANKFSDRQNKSKIVKAFFFISNLLDSLNDFWSSNKVGVSIVAVAEKTT